MSSPEKALGEAPTPSHNEVVHNELSQAPFYGIPPRRFGAVEHPMIIKDIDKGIKTFGRGHSFQAVGIFSLSSVAKC
jgi:general transcription factor 3C polypeptide 5 (transcription factor C subunit 1)